MEAGLGDDVLAQVVDAHVHDLAAIQRAAAIVRGGSGVGGAAGKLEFDADVGQRAGAPGAVDIERVPGKGGVDIAE